MGQYTGIEIIAIWYIGDTDITALYGYGITSGSRSESLVGRAPD